MQVQQVTTGNSNGTYNLSTPQVSSATVWPENAIKAGATGVRFSELSTATAGQ